LSLYNTDVYLNSNKQKQHQPLESVMMYH